MASSFVEFMFSTLKLSALNHVQQHDDDGNDEQPTQESADDLFQYRFENVVLPKGSRVLLELFKPVTIEYRDVHQAEVTLSGGRSVAQSNPIDVWHSIKLKNKSSVPWSTGPVLVTRGDEQSLVCQSSVSFFSISRSLRAVLLMNQLSVA